jgi:hypothetical protein
MKAELKKPAPWRRFGSPRFPSQPAVTTPGDRVDY